MFGTKKYTFSQETVKTKEHGDSFIIHTCKEDKDIVLIQPIHSDLRQALIELSDDYNFRNSSHKVPAEYFLRYYRELELYTDGDDDKVREIKRLFAFIEAKFDYKTILDDLNRRQVMLFQYLNFYFNVGDKIFFRDSEDEYIGGEILETKFKESWMGGRYFEIQYKNIQSDGKTFKTAKGAVVIGDFDKATPFADLRVQKMTPKVYEILAARGKMYSEIACSAAYLMYEGNIARRSYWSTVHLKATGRVMIDRSNMQKIDSDYFRSTRWMDRDEDESTNALKGGIPESDFWMCDPIVYGFSFATKKWGEFRVSGLKPISFQDNAFETLVLDPAKKSMIKALVKQTGNGFEDIIAGKGGGCIFLLHGKPGTGKTLTAEAVAEVLHRPLYSVTVGELGTDPDALEQRLREVLDMADEWNAVLLLDEADIFMEERDEKNIHRNAMVGIFLRLLEYHQGVLFLTTNRAKNIDRAMRSRIAIALNYEDHGEDTRRKIWDNLLGVAGVSTVDVDTVVKHDINGRQIKTAIRIAQSLALEEKVTVTTEHVLSCINLAEEFEKQMEANATA